MPLFSVENICVEYTSESASTSADAQIQPTPKLENVSFALEKGEIYDLVGPSGVGKSMLLRACARMLAIKSGTMYVGGIAHTDLSPQQWRRDVCLVPQHALLTDASLRENLLLPWTFKVRKGETPPTDAELHALLEQTLLDVDLDRSAVKLSGGQAARVALVRAFATKPKVLLLDEVDAALDDDASAAVSALTKRIVEEGCTCLRIRHRASDGLASCTFTIKNNTLTIKDH